MSRGVFFCPGCGDEIPHFGCCSRLVCQQGSIRGGVAMTWYRDVIARTLLHDYKYNGVEEAGKILEHMFVLFAEQRRLLFAEYCRGATYIPVPLHWFRERVRGFNQSERFARVLSVTGGRHSVTNILIRRYQWKRQATLTDEQLRKQNALQSVMLRPNARVHGTYVLVDDVFTTGATMRACADLLKKNGAEHIFVCTVLRG